MYGQQEVRPLFLLFNIILMIFQKKLQTFNEQQMQAAIQASKHAVNRTAFDHDPWQSEAAYTHIPWHGHRQQQ